MDLDLSVEISALEHVFGPFQDDVGTLASSRKLTLNLTPYTGEDDKLFVYMDITFYIGQLYPDAPPKVEVASSRGLSDDRIRTVLQAMLEEAQQLTGEHMLMSMCMAAKEALSQLNHPEGACPFCLEDMQDASMCMRGACFHGFHSSCFRRWWQWRVQQHQLEVQQHEDNRRTVGLGIAPKEQEDMKQAPCPVCRAGIPSTQLAAALLPQEHTQGHPDAAPAASTAATSTQAAPVDASLAGVIDSVSQMHQRISAEQKARREADTRTASASSLAQHT